MPLPDAPTCPKCKTNDGVRAILYGMPSEWPDESLYKIGGCIVGFQDPQWECVTCGWQVIPPLFDPWMLLDDEDATATDL